MPYYKHHHSLILQYRKGRQYWFSVNNTPIDQFIKTYNFVNRIKLLRYGK